VSLFYVHHKTNLSCGVSDLPISERLQGLMPFLYAFAVLDGCHLPIQRPTGPIAQRDRRNYKNFYSIILMALADGKGWLLWAQCAMPGNVHDPTVLRGSNLWPHLPVICVRRTANINNASIPGLILVDSTFPFLPYAMKIYSYKKHSESRVQIENTFGLLKMRFRELFKTSEKTPQQLIPL